MYGNPELTTGGRALNYYASVRIDIRRVEGLKDSSGPVSYTHLDVYKRQVQTALNDWLGESAQLKYPMPVSYTHLDVYKRQGCKCEHEAEGVVCF